MWMPFSPFNSSVPSSYPVTLADERGNPDAMPVLAALFREKASPSAEQLRVVLGEGWALTMIPLPAVGSHSCNSPLARAAGANARLPAPTKRTPAAEAARRLLLQATRQRAAQRAPLLKILVALQKDERTWFMAYPPSAKAQTLSKNSSQKKSLTI
ncbi:hypothetical protein [Achromobacter animicus]|uniref:hypothetical protein n=1 Tax=Achromobacter animicus TaxID=1389935 RepID=UPI0028A7CF24|nr:hypothetical protein [Achromobacter animicus]